MNQRLKVWAGLGLLMGMFFVGYNLSNLIGSSVDTQAVSPTSVILDVRVEATYR